MKRAQAKSGFALLMALMLIAIAVVTLASLARRSTVAALNARGAAEELKLRWAVTSCQYALLGSVEKVLERTERGGPAHKDEQSERYKNQPVAQLALKCRLAGIDYELVLTDEQAKLNPNYLLKRHGRAGTEAILSRLSGVSRVARGKAMVVKLRKTPLLSNLLGKSEPLPAVGGYGQVFENASPRQLVGDKWSPGAAAGITCWSDGKVNVRRASSAVIERACEKMVQPRVVNELLEVRKRNPYQDLQGMLAEVSALDAVGRAKLSACLTDRSSCHGLWVIADTGQRCWYWVSIGKGVGGKAPANKPPMAGQAAGAGVFQGRRYDFSW